MYLVGSVTLITCQYWTGFPDGHNAFASVLSETELEVEQREADNDHHDTVRDEKGTCKDTTLCDVIYNIHSYMQQVIICCRSLTKKNCDCLKKFDIHVHHFITFIYFE